MRFNCIEAAAARARETRISTVADATQKENLRRDERESGPHG
jgi:hypothetical protein